MSDTQRTDSIEVLHEVYDDEGALTAFVASDYVCWFGWGLNAKQNAIEAAKVQIIANSQDIDKLRAENKRLREALNIVYKEAFSALASQKGEEESRGE